MTGRLSGAIPGLLLFGVGAVAVAGVGGPGVGPDGIAPSRIVLPYDSRHRGYVYTEYQLGDGIDGVRDWACGVGEPLYYVPFPAKGDVSVIAVRMDCGDFPYREYLLTVFEGAIVDGIYVEGEWWEPDSGMEETELTRFTIDGDYTITVYTVCQPSGAERVARYRIGERGTFVGIGGQTR